MRKILALPLLACLFVLPDAGRPGRCVVQVTEPLLRQELAGPTTVACSPDKPTVVSGESIKVRVWAESSGTGLRYDWTATAGTIKGEDAEAVWDLRGVTAGVYESTVTATDREHGRVACTMQVIVREHTMGEGYRVTGRYFLLKGQKEKPGYGLYSYLLFGSPPDDSSRDRYRIAIDAYLHQLTEIERLEDEPSVDLAQLNVTYLPVDMAPPPDPSADWALAHYDYSRARLMLLRFSGASVTGPYIVSLLKPLGGTDKVSGPYLFQNLSTVPAVPKDLLYWWVREFQSQAAQERFWEERSGQRLTLKLRTIVAILALAVPEVRRGLDTAIAWVH